MFSLPACRVWRSETRTRQLFKERYDHRYNVIDWDYTMRVQPEASILHFLHYSHFRDKGLAYELRECEYSEPNYTLASRVEGKSVRALLSRVQRMI